MEGEILRGLGRLRLDGDAPPWVRVASRTDAGVSAVGNALTLSSRITGRPLLRALNGIAPEIRFTRTREVPEGFNPRHATERRYTYFELEGPVHRTAWEAGARLFEGRVDTRTFGRGVRTDAPVWREVTSVEVHEEADGLRVEIRGRSFAWGMVRKMISALRRLDRGEIGMEELRLAIDGRRRLTLPLAEPEALVLAEVSYPDRWEVEEIEPARHQKAYIAEELQRGRRRRWVLDRMAGVP